MKKLLHWYFGLNIYIQLFPFLLLYLAICAKFAPANFVDDEERYVRFANNLLHGFYSPPLPNIDLWNGPGYPAIVASFLLFKLPLMAVRLFNGVLLYFSLALICKSINRYTSKKTALAFAFILGLYFPVFEKLPLILTECPTWFLISLICYLFLKLGRQQTFSKKYIVLSGLALAFLTMVKIVFGYVIIAMIFVSLMLFLSPKSRLAAKKFTCVFSLSFLLCVSYLTYTYHITHKFFYWTNSGGWSLFTMSAPYANDWGDWKDNPQMLDNPNYKVFVDSVLKLTPLERDAAYKTKGVENIKKYPKKYLLNCVANVGRLLFSYPFTNMEQDIKTYYTIIPNMFVAVFMVITIGLSIFHYKKLPDELILLLFFILIYLAGSTLVSGFRRMFYVTMPFWILFFAYVLTNIVSIKIKKD
ncbi:MAG: hypothetical protein EOP42_05665 [Sphingobacteriaceae bacterium]|nr:MAG: hypothetical protein EOP42_05665 [Sphingobacteriaceae bacterium]